MTSRPGPLVARFIRQYSSAQVRSALSPNGLTALGTTAAAIPEAQAHASTPGRPARA
jgi:hypothetical protein